MCLFNSTKITSFSSPSAFKKRQLSNGINYLSVVSQSAFFTLKTLLKLFGSIHEVFPSSDLAGHTTR